MKNKIINLSLFILTMNILTTLKAEKDTKLTACTACMHNCSDSAIETPNNKASSKQSVPLKQKVSDSVAIQRRAYDTPILLINPIILL